MHYSTVKPCFLNFMVITAYFSGVCIFRIFTVHKNKWAATQRNQQSDCVPSENTDQPGHLPSLIRVFAVRMKEAWALSYPLSAQLRLRSDWADAQADLSLCWAHTYFVGFVMSRLKCADFAVCCSAAAEKHWQFVWRLCPTWQFWQRTLITHVIGWGWPTDT